MGAPKFGDARDVARTLEDYKRGRWSVGRILSISDDSTLGSYPPLRFNFVGVTTKVQVLSQPSRYS
jgi:hypothetical protein